MREDEQQPDEREEPEATVLPAREAMSLISPDPAAPSFMPDTGQADEAGTEEPSDQDSDEETGSMLL